MDKLNGGFGAAPIKGDGMIANPDEFTFECDLRTCAKCAKKYAEWKELYDQQQAKLRSKNDH
jgi:anti-sigma factor RsiW